MNTQQDSQQKPSSEWLTYVQEIMTPKKTGQFLAKDKSDMPIIMEWENIDSQSPQLNEKIRSLSEILVQTYTQLEIQFARKFPEAVPNEYFLKSLAPLFNDGVEKVDWNLVKGKIKAIFQDFFKTADFTQFSTKNDVTFFVVARDQKTETPLGLIQFLITPEYAYGNVKAGYYGVTPTAQKRELEKLLMSSIFKLLPTTKRIFLHTRITNENALNDYHAWGFTQSTGAMPNWPDLEYIAEQSSILQKTAETLEK